MRRLKEYKENNKRFSLIEVLVVISIYAILLVIFTSVIIKAKGGLSSITRRISVKQMAELHVTEISKYIKNANEKEMDTEENKITTDKVTLSYYDDDNKINIFNVVTRSINNKIILILIKNEIIIKSHLRRKKR